MGKAFEADAEAFVLVRECVGEGRVVDLRPADAGLLAPHIPGHPDTVYAAASGIPPTAGSDGPGVAVEWVREERRPRPGEPECNLYRYVFYPTPDGRCLGREVTRRTAGGGQVGDHWTSLDDSARSHFA